MLLVCRVRVREVSMSGRRHQWICGRGRDQSYLWASRTPRDMTSGSGRGGIWSEYPRLCRPRWDILADGEPSRWWWAVCRSGISVYFGDLVPESWWAEDCSRLEARSGAIRKILIRKNRDPDTPVHDVLSCGGLPSELLQGELTPLSDIHQWFGTSRISRENLVSRLSLHHKERKNDRREYPMTDRIYKKTDRIYDKTPFQRGAEGSIDSTSVFCHSGRRYGEAFREWIQW